MSIRLDDLELIKRVEDPQTRVVKEIRSVYNISTSERRMIMEHKIPGSDGSILQDMGKEPLRISFEGVFLGEKAKENLQDLWSRFKQGKPMNFSSDITGIADVTKVMIEGLRIDDIAGYPNEYHYSILLSEYREPRLPPAQPPSQEEQAQQEVQNQADDTIASINYITGKVLDDEGNPQKDIDVVITKDDGTEYKIKTDENGIYRMDDMSPGKYTVVVKAEGYEDMKEEVEIKAG
ncbi:MAG: carboxypeptidase regulatory-like domain-containing protein [archaeon]|nr:carboxypeptidase regulatory-like domain-containing protein [archaeon]MCP8313246.1 carboxypeptidase regulatory-like domain-containing protein [archaeon]MCP8319801.1 carboxypeptidase regulatory-like domain-containing protein [archaeon]